MKAKYCPECNTNTTYHIKQEELKEYKGYQVNIIKNIGVCDNCNEEIFIEELEQNNFARLYSKYEDCIGSKLLNGGRLTEDEQRYFITKNKKIKYN